MSKSITSLQKKTLRRPLLLNVTSYPPRTAKVLFPLMFHLLPSPLTSLYTPILTSTASYSTSQTLKFCTSFPYLTLRPTYTSTNFQFKPQGLPQISTEAINFQFRPKSSKIKHTHAYKREKREKSFDLGGED